MPKINVMISVDGPVLEKFDEIVGKGKRGPKIQELMEEFNELHGKSEVIEEQLKLEE